MVMVPTRVPEMRLMRMTSLEDTNREMSGSAMSVPPMPVRPLMKAPMNQAPAMMSRSFMLPSENGVKQASMPLGRFCKWKKEGNFRPGAQKKTCRKQAFPCFCAAGRLYAYYAEPFLRVRALHPFRRKGEGGKVPSEQAVFFLRRMPLHREKSAVCRRGVPLPPGGVAFFSCDAALSRRGVPYGIFSVFFAAVGRKEAGCGA